MYENMKIAALILMTASSLLTWGMTAAQTPINVVTTTGMITDTVKQIGGDRVQVTGLMGAGVDPHLYRPTAGDIQTLQNADIIFRNGGNLEGRMGDIFDRLSRRIPVYTLMDAMPSERLFAHPIYAGFSDPHVWFDVSLWSEGIDVVVEGLSALDPAGAEVYAANAAAYREKLRALDAYIADAIAAIPRDQRVLITAHDAFAYFGARYGLEVTGLQGVSTEAEAGVQDVQNLVTFVVENRIPAVFIETSVPQRTIEAVVQAARARGWEVRIGGELFSDAPGDSGTLEGTYIGMMLHNLIAVVPALGGELPPLPDALADYQPMFEE
jgi:manganese/zinc/iron transport system substrate-binding protein